MQKLNNILLNNRSRRNQKANKNTLKQINKKDNIQKLMGCSKNSYKKKAYSNKHIHT